MTTKKTVASTTSNSSQSKTTTREEDRRIITLRESGLRTDRKYRGALRQIDALEREMSALLHIKETSYTHTIEPYRSGDKSEATAVVLASDWHVEEEVKRSKVSGLNRYNLDIAKARAHQFFQRAVKMVQKEQQDIPIKEMVLWLGGDFFSGNIHEELLENCLLQPIDAARYAQELLASGIIFILENTKLKLTIPCSCGNHSRITGKTHISTEQGNSIEFFMYHMLKIFFQNEPRVTFVIDEGYHTYIDIYNRQCRFHHGHSIRFQGGVGGLTIPVNKAISQWNKARSAFIDCFGHYHTSMSLSNFVGNGSLIGFNAFAISIKADFERPQQSMFLIDKTRGKTVSIPLLFDI